MSVVDEKKLLRKDMLRKRLAMNPSLKKDYDYWICEELKKTIIVMNCRKVHAYIPIANEIDINPFLTWLLESGNQVICPKTLPKRRLENRVLLSLDQLEVGIMGTKHPAQPLVYNGTLDIIIVPGLAFDSSGNRLGYGGAYYDTFLAANPKVLKIGIFYPFQKINTVPVEPHDVRLDNVIYNPLTDLYLPI